MCSASAVTTSRWQQIYLFAFSSVPWWTTLSLVLIVHFVRLDVEEPETVICISWGLCFSSFMWCLKGRHYSGSARNSFISVSNPQQQNNFLHPLPLASSCSFSLFGGAVCVVSNFRCCEAFCETIVLTLVKITSVGAHLLFSVHYLEMDLSDAKLKTYLKIYL